MISQNEYLLLKRNIRNVNTKIELLNKNLATVASFEGIATGGNITLDGSSNYRRAGNLEMILDKKYNLLPSPTSKIWVDSLIRVCVGLRNHDDTIYYFNMGIFAILDVAMDFNVSEKKIRLQMADMMSRLDGTLGGKLSHETRIVAKDVTVNDAIKATLSGLGKVSLDNVVINGEPALVPMDIEKSPGTTAYELIKELAELYMDYEFYFNEDGYFRLEKIKDKKSDAIVWDFTDIDLSVDYQRQLDFKNVHNSIWVWGKQLDNGIQIVHNYKNKYARDTVILMNSIMDKEINDICHVVGDNNSYIWNGSTWQMLDFTVIPEFNIESIGEKVGTYSDTNIFTEAQAKLRCEYELKNTSNFAETVSFNTVPIYALKPNSKVKLRQDEIDIDGDYLIKSVNIPLDIGSTSPVSCTKIYY